MGKFYIYKSSIKDTAPKRSENTDSKQNLEAKKNIPKVEENIKKNEEPYSETMNYLIIGGILISLGYFTMTLLVILGGIAGLIILSKAKIWDSWMHFLALVYTILGIFALISIFMF